jgi:hypothetical protein
LKHQDLACRMVCFLKALVDLGPQNVYHLLKRRDSFADQAVLRENVKEFAALRGLSASVVQQFMDFLPQTRAADFPTLEGPELGAAIRDGVVKEYLALCRK